MPRGNEPLGPIATELLFENDRVKIWTLIVDPQKKSAWHQHPLDYITIGLEAGEISLELEDGSTRVSQPEVARSWKWHDEHPVHRVVNNSDTTYRNILIELKK